MLNKIMLQGRLTKDPELRYTNSGTPHVEFSMAVERNYTDNSGERPVDFINCKAWRGAAEAIAKYFDKGKEILVTGELRQDRWVNDDGDNRSRMIVNVDSFNFTSGSNGGQQDAEPDPEKEKGPARGPEQSNSPAQKQPEPAEDDSPPPAPPEDFDDDDFDVPF